MALSVLDSIKHWPSAEARNWAYQEIPVLCSLQNVRAVVLFGSIVRDVPSALDLDVLYIYEGSAPTPTKPPIDVDLRKFEQKAVEELLSKGNDLLSWCIKFGQPVCEHNQYWSQLVQRWTNKLGLPSSEVALERARKSENLLRSVDSMGDDDAALELYLSLLTHIARAVLIRGGVYPASRPELANQLTQIGEEKLASYLRDAIVERNAAAHGIRQHRRKIWRAFLDEYDAGKVEALAP